VIGPQTEAALIAAGASAPGGRGSASPATPAARPVRRFSGQRTIRLRLMPRLVQQPAPPNGDGQQLVNCSVPVVLDRFELGDYRLRPHHYERLLDVADALTALAGSDVVLSIQGHTDSSGSERLNVGLSLSRAFEVFAFLQFFFGGTIPVETQIEGLGETSPIPGADAARNRRVEFRLCQRPAAPPPIITAARRGRAPARRRR
ncbi:MAG: OmpA family protein, partial [Acidobacteria bacterium]|nr:OmpA family protein [Acidobacteriota bacterium]